MSAETSLSPFIVSKQLKRGAALQMVGAKLLPEPIATLIEHVRENYLVVSYQITSDVPIQFLGHTLTLEIENETTITSVELEVIQEQLVWPVLLIGMIPVSLQITQKELPLVKPDFIINVPYKVMGAKPVEEKGEGVLLEFTPSKLLMGTDAFVSKGDFINLSFVVPRASKQELVAMAKVVEKQFIDGSSRLLLTFKDIDPKHQRILKEYYEKCKKV